MKRRVLVVDVGGANVKLYVTGRRDLLKIPSGPKLTPRGMVAAIEKEAAARGWEFDAISLGVPAPVVLGKIIREPAHLGRGWTRFDFARATRKPLRIVNDAAMQALGSHHRGKMLFLGFGTSLGSALVVDGVLVPLELAPQGTSRRDPPRLERARGVRRRGPLAGHERARPRARPRSPYTPTAESERRDRRRGRRGG